MFEMSRLALNRRADHSPSSPLSEVLLPRLLIVGGADHDPKRTSLVLSISAVLNESGRWQSLGKYKARIPLRRIY